MQFRELTRFLNFNDLMVLISPLALVGLWNKLIAQVLCQFMTKFQILVRIRNRI